ncbi:hypothetical protein [Roseivivax marinus]|uniref:hypothetical protein n=1 Tax=Roseivivax marinus TaxID=1379903 RepID=UPI00273E8E2B|nr:hypothetical protein [Roseivivax marinus]
MNEQATLANRITVFTSDRRPLAKRFWVEGDEIRKQAVASLYEGEAKTVHAPTAAALEDVLAGLTQREAVSAGTLKGRDRARIATQSKGAGDGATRSLRHFEFSAGPGWLLWDYDSKTMPREVSHRVEALGGPLAALLHIWPEAQQGAYLIRPSSSDGITAPGCGTISSTGLHGFFRVADVSRSREALEALEARAWAAGLAWVALSKAGAILRRSIVDVAVGSPERLIFEAPPILQEPVTRKARAPIIHEAAGDIPTPAVDANTQARAREAERVARHRIKPEADRIESEFLEDRAETLAKRTGCTRKAARQTVAEMLHGKTLADDDTLQMSDGGWIRVGDVLDNPESYDRRGVPDPIEGLAYGPDKATLLLRPRPGRTDKPCLVSHAHGWRTVYRFARFEAPPPRPPFYPKPEGRKEDHGTAVKRFMRGAVRDVRARRETAERYAQLSDDCPELADRERRKRQLEIRRQVQAQFGLEYLPPSRQTDIAPGLRVMLTGAQGTGKTRTVIQELRQARGMVSLVLQPDHSKAAEFEADYLEAADQDTPHIITLRGRSAQDPENRDVTMCRVPLAAEALAKRGLSPKQTLCAVCPMRDECGHLRQEARLKRLAADPAGVVVVAPAEYGFCALPGEVEPDLVIFDEAPRGLAKDRAAISFDALGETLAYEQPPRIFGREAAAGAEVDALADNIRLIRPLRIALRNAFQDAPEAPLAHMRAAGVTAGKAREALAALTFFEDQAIKDKAANAFQAATLAAVHGRPVDYDSRLLAEIDAHGDKAVKAFRHVVETVMQELETGRDTANAVLRCANINVRAGRQGVSKGIEAFRIQRPHFPENIPLLHLDGTGDRDLAERIFGPLTLEAHRVERNANVIQVTGREWTKASITGAGFKAGTISDKRKAEAAELRRELVDFCHSKPGALVVAPKAVVEALQADGLQNPAGNFNALRGRNTWEDCDTAIIISREEPTGEIEEMARAFAATDPAPFYSLKRPDGTFARWHKEARGLRMRDGSAVSLDVNRHPDPWGERVLRQVRDGELVQAIDRLRPHYKPEPVTVFLLSEVVLDVTVDRTTRWIDLKKGGSRSSQAIETAGVLPLSESEATRLFPGVWKARQTAQEDLPAWRSLVASLSAENPSNIYYSENRQLSGALLARYQTAPRGPGGRAGRSHQALVWAEPENARETLEAITGELRTFELVPEWLEVMATLDARAEREAIQAENAEPPQHPEPATAPPWPATDVPGVTRLPSLEEREQWRRDRHATPERTGTDPPGVDG